ncbi:Coiled-coil domain-containing protein 66, putative [Leishmania donovani]|uniref:Coiled-coil domain-containing protein 66, putative n=1 Tax=Leishmania donovani TaxID=5661 RepID=A0A3S7WWJ6_LEIDO|nr:Coiled-coil domain-containing protein 66, putative [Leishmania donovani]
MLREARRRKQQVAAKIGHEEYIYRLNGNPFSHQEVIRVRPQGDLDPRRVQAAGIRVGVGGARGVGGPSRPPFAVDDDANYSNGGGRGSRVAPLNPSSGVPNDGPSNEAVAPYSAPEGCNGGTPRGKKYAAANYASPYGGGGGGADGHPHPLVSQGQHIVSTFTPVIPAIAPVRDLPAPLPAVYRPKPPLTFHSGPASGAEVPPLSLTPLPQHPAPSQVCYPSSEAGTPRAAAAPVYLSPGEKGAGRPSTSPTVLPPLNSDGGNSSGGGPFPTRSPRPSTSGAALGGGGFLIGGDGLSAAEERHREKMAARQRAVELQRENARQILEKQQRKQAEREREIQEYRLAEERLQREREEVARREQAELDREKREKELKMMAPRAAQAMLEQQQRETQQRREEEAAARRNRARAPATPAAPEAPEAPEVPEAPEAPEMGKEALKSTALPLPASANVASTSLQSQPPANHLLPLAAPSVLPPPAPAPALPYLVDFNFGSGLRHSPQPLPTPYYYPPANMCPQAALLPNADTQSIRSELRRITNLLEEQQLQQRRAMDSISIGANAAPQPWHSGTPQPSTKAGAGTYLTTGQPSPSIGAGGPAPVITAQRNSAAPYRSFSTGGTLPPPPLATAAPPAPSSSGAGAPSVGIGTWQGLLSPYAGTSAAGAGGSLLNPPSRSIPQFTSSITDNEPELSTEPSRFIGPFRAPVTAVPSPPPVPVPGVTLVGADSMATKPLPPLVHRAGVTEPDAEHCVATPPPASTAASSRLSPVSSASALAPARFSMPEMNSPTRSPNVEGLPSVRHGSPQATEGSRTDADEGEPARRVSESPMS